MGLIIYFLLKNGPIIYLAALKKGPFGTHTHTMPYIESYPRPQYRGLTYLKLKLCGGAYLV